MYRKLYKIRHFPISSAFNATLTANIRLKGMW